MLYAPSYLTVLTSSLGMHTSWIKSDHEIQVLAMETQYYEGEFIQHLIKKSK